MTGMGAYSSNNEESFRQVGTKINGSRRKPIRKPPMEKQASSIPSKFETVLNLNTRGTDAFGNRTSRFGDTDNELPGPGSYYSSSSLVRNHSTCGSVSQLGFGGGFVSKTKRFNNDDTVDFIPGPGHYNSTVGGKNSFNTAVGLSSFAKPKTTNPRIKKPIQINPGPGEYNTPNSQVKKKSGGASSSFNSRTRRGHKDYKETPAPGQYENPLGMVSNTSKLMQSCFKSQSKRITDTSSCAPGPGSYAVEAAEDFLRKDIVSNSQPSSMFCTNQDRFSISISGKQSHNNIGPGSYNSFVQSSNSNPASTVFKSKTKRIGDTSSTKLPGPAFYNPAGVNKKSYLLNASRRWT